MEWFKSAETVLKHVWKSYFYDFKNESIQVDSGRFNPMESLLKYKKKLICCSYLAKQNLRCQKVTFQKWRILCELKNTLNTVMKNEILCLTN